MLTKILYENLSELSRLKNEFLKENEEKICNEIYLKIAKQKDFCYGLEIIFKNIIISKLRDFTEGDISFFYFDTSKIIKQFE